MTKILAPAIKRAAGTIINGNGRTAKNLSVAAALLALSSYLATEVYTNLKAADARSETSIVESVRVLRAEAKDRQDLDRERWDRQNDINDAMLKTLEVIRERLERKP